MERSALVLLLALVFPGALGGQGSSCDVDATDSQARVGADFSYPEAMQTTDLGTILVKSVAGRVVDGNGNPVERALVERLSRNGRRRDAILTDSNGCFAFPRLREGQYGVRVSYPSFDTFVLQVRVKERNSGDLELTLIPST